jgi:hypothetical protein
MAKSSYGLVLLFAGWGIAAEAEPPASGYVTAEEAMKHYRETFGVSGGERTCPRTGEGDEEAIVVCGGRPRRERLPLPIERDPGEIVRHVNEADGMAALNAGACLRGCQEPPKGSILTILFAAPKVIRHLLGKDD